MKSYISYGIAQWNIQPFLYVSFTLMLFWKLHTPFHLHFKPLMFRILFSTFCCCEEIKWRVRQNLCPKPHSLSGDFCILVHQFSDLDFFFHLKQYLEYFWSKRDFLGLISLFLILWVQGLGLLRYNSHSL